ncbi:MAG: hypothetical protein IPI67_27250 [Myxococcales bacterium]|nr:hypothetical protein [Myxococcales bacterium]
MNPRLPAEKTPWLALLSTTKLRVEFVRARERALVATQNEPSQARPRASNPPPSKRAA